MGIPLETRERRFDRRRWIAAYLFLSLNLYTVNEAAQHKIVWGWLRFFLGFAQMSLVAASVGALVAVGLRPVTLLLVIAASAATLISRLLYHGRSDPKPRC